MDGRVADRGGAAAGVRWHVVVPVKLLERAKTRLGAYGPAGRAELALAFADDVVTAALACPLVAGVAVVTDDVRAARVLGRDGVRVLPDVPGGGLNDALGAGAAARARPRDGVAALASDLPTLRAQDLGAALAAVAVRAFVPDAAGTGTTLLAAAPGVPLRPAYGPGSRAAHLASGAVELPAPLALRLDVDTPSDLLRALSLGTGPRTTAVAARVLRASA